MEDPAPYFNQQAKPYREVMYHLHALLLRASEGISVKLIWNQPFYYYRGAWFCYVSYVKKWKCVELGFTKGHLLSDPDGILLDRNRKTVKSIEFQSREDITRREDFILEAIQRALLLNEEGQPS